MKKIILLILLCFLSNISFSQYAAYNFSNGSSVAAFRSLTFVNTNVGFGIVNIYNSTSNSYDLKMAKTTNKGINWQFYTIGDDSYEFNYNEIGQTASISFINENTGYALFANGVAKTTNGGSNWHVRGVDGFIGNVYSSIIKFYDENTGYVAIERDDKNNLLFMKTTDGGNFWGWAQGPGYVFQTDPSNPRKFYVKDIAIDKLNPNVFAIVGNSFGNNNPNHDYNSLYFIYSSPDGGSTMNYSTGGGITSELWGCNSVDIVRNANNQPEVRALVTKDISPTNKSIWFRNETTNTEYKVDDFNSDALYTVGNGIKFNTTDGGNTGYCSAQGRIYKSTNGGTNWNRDYYAGSTDHSKYQRLNIFGDVLYSGHNDGTFVAKKLAINQLTLKDNLSVSGFIGIQDDPNHPYFVNNSTPYAYYVYGGDISRNLVNSYINQDQTDEAIFYKWNDGLRIPTVTSTYYNNFTLAQYFKTRNISTDNTAISKAASTKTIKESHGNIDRIHTSLGGGIFFARSTDNGATFVHEEIVNNDNTNRNLINSNPYIAEVKTILSGGVDASKNSAAVYEQRDGNNINIMYSQRQIVGSLGVWGASTPSTGGPAFTVDATGHPDLQCLPKVSAIKTSSASDNYFTVISYINSDGKLKAKINMNGGATNLDYTIANETVTDFAIISNPITSGGNGHSIDYAFLRNNAIYYKHINFYVYSPNFVADASGEFNVSNGDGNTLRYSPDISLKKGKAIITYQGAGSITKAYSTGSISEEPHLLTLPMYPVIVRFRLNSSDPTNASNWSSWIKQPSSGSTVQSQPNIEGSASPNTNVESYILNYKKGDNIYAQFTSLPGYRTDPPYYLGTDSKLIKGSYINPTDGALLTTLSTQVSSVYTLGKQSVGIISNSISVADGVYNNISGVVEMNSTQYIFNLGPIIVSSGSALLETPQFGDSITEGNPHTCMEFNEYMKSEPFSLSNGDTLILGTSASYVDNENVH